VSAAPRAKPLNALTLAALPVGLEAWDAEIAYLADALQRTDSAALVPALRGRFQAKHAALVRARDWLAAKIAAETHHPEESEHG
jgi:hypothetical protein